MTARQSVRGLYRQLFRAQQLAFQGDTLAQTRARQRIREEFLKHKEVDVNDSQKMDSLFREGRDVVRLLREHVIQAEATERGTYQLRIRSDHKMTNHQLPASDC